MIKPQCVTWQKSKSLTLLLLLQILPLMTVSNTRPRILEEHCSAEVTVEARSMHVKHNQFISSNIWSLLILYG